MFLGILPQNLHSDVEIVYPCIKNRVWKVGDNKKICIHQYIYMSKEKDTYVNRKTSKDQTVWNKRNRFGQQIQKVFSASLIMRDT